MLLSRFSLHFLSDYIYTGIQSIHDVELELLLEAITLSGYWQIHDLFEAMQREIIQRKLFSPQSLDLSKRCQFHGGLISNHFLSFFPVRMAATTSQAETLLQACDEYEENNASLIRKIRGILPAV
jgi:hypothetical protein